MSEKNENKKSQPSDDHLSLGERVRIYLRLAEDIFAERLMDNLDEIQRLVALQNEVERSLPAEIQYAVRRLDDAIQSAGD